MSLLPAVGQRPDAPPDADPDPRAAPREQSRRRPARVRPVWLLVVGLLVVITVITILTTAPADALDPRSATQQGTRALAVLLEQRGVQVTVSSGAVAAAGETTVVADPDTFSRDELRALAGQAGSGTLVLLDPDSAALAAAGLPAVVTGSAADRDLAPDCTVAAAVTAGSALMGGGAFALRAPGAACYQGHLAEVTLASGTRVVLLGDPRFLENDSLDHGGDAALAVGLLEGRARVSWLLAQSTTPTSVGGQHSLLSFLPGRLDAALGELLIAVALLALARGRRLGPPVSEPLPVVVRASETALGRARLYQSAHARDAAADALRAGTRERLTRRLGTTGPESLVLRVAERSGRDTSQVRSLLYGAGSAPLATDDDLVRLAADLSLLDRQVPAL